MFMSFGSWDCFEKNAFTQFKHTCFRLLYQLMRVCVFLFCFEGGVWDLIVLIPDHCNFLTMSSFHFRKMFMLHEILDLSSSKYVHLLL